MSYKGKLLILAFILGSISTTTLATNKYDSELIVSGSNMWERVEGTLENGGKNHGKTDGETSIGALSWIEKGGTIHNIGTMKSNMDSYDTVMVGVVFAGIDNEIVKTDNYIYMTGKSKLKNDGIIDIDGIKHNIKSVNIAGIIPTELTYANYTRNIVQADNSSIENNGKIYLRGDENQFTTYLAVSLLESPYTTTYNKNVISLNNSSIVNSGEIIADRDKQLRIVEGVDVDLLNFGTYYYVNTTGIAANNKSNIINEKGGKIFVGGDVYGKKSGGGITIEGLGADIIGTHEKYGVKLNNSSYFENKGLIEVERDYKYDIEGNILDIGIIVGGELIGVDLLYFGNRAEMSIGVDLENSIFDNNGGTIRVASNAGGSGLIKADSKAIAINGANQSTINFNGGKIELEGTNVWAGYLTQESKMIFKGDSYIYYQTKGNNDKLKVNKDIFHNDKNSKYIIEGTLTIDGKTPDIIKENADGAETIIEKGEQFAGDLVIGSGDNIYLGLGDIVINSNLDGTTPTKKFGTIHTTGLLTLNEKIKVEGSYLVGYAENQGGGLDDSKLNDFIGNEVIIAEGGMKDNISQSPSSNPIDSPVESGSYVFNVKTKTEIVDGNHTTVSIDSITRNSFNDIVDDKELGKIFEDNYATATSGQTEVYRYLAGGEDKVQFENRITEVTGRDTITTLNSQIYDITKDLNKQFKDFAKSNTDDGVVFKYINSKSELGANSLTVGFERKSSGIMVGYNNYLSEKLRLGAGFSYMKSDIDYTSASSNDVTTWNFRGYSDYNLGYANLFSDISFGYNQAENKRLSEGVDSTGVKEGDLDVYSLSFNNSLYKNYKLNDKLSLTTSLNLDFTYLYQEEYEETGLFSASADSTDAFYITAGIGVDGKYNLVSFGNSKINLVAGIEYAYDIVSETEKTMIKMKDFTDVYHEEIRELDKKSMTYDIGLNYEYMDRYSVGVRYTKELINDVDNDQIGVDFTYKF